MRSVATGVEVDTFYTDHESVITQLLFKTLKYFLPAKKGAVDASSK